MGRKWDANEVSDSQFIVFPNGLFHVEIESATEEADKNGLLFYLFVLKVHKPTEFEGLTWTHRAYVGTHEDPEADEPTTRRKSGGLRLLKRICFVTDVPFGQDTDEMCAALYGKQFVGRNQQREYAGDVFNDLRWAYAIGEAQPEVHADQATGAKRPAMRPATVAKDGDGLARGAGFVATAATAQRPAFGPVQVFDE